MRLALVVLLAGIAPTLGAFALAAGADDYEVQEVRPGVFVLRGSGPNVTVLDGVDRLLVIDSSPERCGGELRQAIESIRRAPIRFLVNTHHHAENVDGNEAVTGEDTIVVAHEFGDERMRADGGRGASLRFRSRLTLDFGDETVTCHHKGAAHTGGDTVVHLGGANVVVVGGLVARRAHPAFVRDDGADLRSWIRVLIELERDFRGSGVLVVPGDGEPGGLEIVVEQLDYLRAVLDLMEDAQRRGMSRDEARRTAEGLRDRYSEYRGDHFERLLDAAYDTAGR